MKTQAKPFGPLLCTFLCLATGQLHAQVQQLNAGAVGTNVNDKLAFVNGANYDTNSGYAHPLIYTIIANASQTNVYYGTTNLAFSALSGKTNAGSAAIGSYLLCEVVSVDGPAGGVFSFWEQGSRLPTYAFPVGGTFGSGSNRFDVSDIALGAGLPDGDPYGGIRGRRLTVDKPGEYVVGFKLFDTSKNSLAIGPLHIPSDTLSIKFTTGYELFMTSAAWTNDVATLTFRQGGLTNLFLEASTNLSESNWVAIVGPFTNAPPFGNVTTLIDTNSASARYYRLRGIPPE